MVDAMLGAVQRGQVTCRVMAGGHVACMCGLPTIEKTLVRYPKDSVNILLSA